MKNGQQRMISKDKKTKKNPTASSPAKALPKSIRDELRMSCALWGYSSIRVGDEKTVKQQQAMIERFFHGKTGITPSQIDMLCQGKFQYSDLFESKEIRTVTRKSVLSNKKKDKQKTTTAATRQYLKQSLSRDDSVFYYLGSDISYHDLKKKNRTGVTLLNGRQLLDMAKRGLKDYRKALAYATDKWDIKKCEPIESGTTVDDVIEYVRRRMYLSAKSASNDDCDEDDNVVETDLMNKLKNAMKEKEIDSVDDDGNDDEGSDDNNKEDNKNDDDNGSALKSIENDDQDNDDDNEDGNKDSDTDDNKEGEKKCDENDDDDKGDNDDDEYENEEDDDDDDSIGSDYVPETYFFHSYFAFCLWGPFADKSKQLPILILGK